MDRERLQLKLNATLGHPEMQLTLAVALLLKRREGGCKLRRRIFLVLEKAAEDVSRDADGLFPVA